MAPRTFHEPVYTPPRKPGRPRKANHSEDDQGRSLTKTEGDPVEPILPRLLDLKATAAYLGLSHWTVRELEAQHVLMRVRIPLPNDGEVRKLLFDRADLDRLIEIWEEPS